MKKVLSLHILFLFFLFTGCQSDTLDQINTLDRIRLTLTGVTDHPVKTTLNDDYTVSWLSSDVISVFSDSAPDMNELFQNHSDHPDQATFTGEITRGTSYTAVFPYSEKTEFRNDSIITELPHIQQSIPESFSYDANLSVAKTSDNLLHFENTCSLISFTMPDTPGADIVQATCEGLNNEMLSGKVSIDMNASTQVAQPTKHSKNSVVLNGPLESGHTYYFVAIPNEFSKGLKLTFKDSTGQFYSAAGHTPVKTSAGRILPLGKIVLDDAFHEISLPGYSMTSTSSNTVTDGLTVTRISYQSDSKRLVTFLYEVDLNHENLNITQITPFNKPIGNSVQSCTQQAEFADSPELRILGGTNSDFFDNRYGTNLPEGVFYSKGMEYKGFNSGLDLNKRSFFYIDSEKKAGIGYARDFEKISGQMKIHEACGGKAVLVWNGEAIPNSDPAYEPRTCIGVSKNGKKVFIMVADGRKSGYSDGMTQTDAGIYMKGAGVAAAINLDGGGSSTFYIRENATDEKGIFKLLNRPSDLKGERSVPSSLVIVSQRTIHKGFQSLEPYLW